MKKLLRLFVFVAAWLGAVSIFSGLQEWITAHGIPVHVQMSAALMVFAIVIAAFVRLAALPKSFTQQLLAAAPANDRSGR